MSEVGSRGKQDDDEPKGQQTKIVVSAVVRNDADNSRL
jgi:hypothetical protein